MVGRPCGPKPLLPPDSTSANARMIAPEMPAPRVFAARSKSASDKFDVTPLNNPGVINLPAARFGAFVPKEYFPFPNTLAMSEWVSLRPAGESGWGRLVENGVACLCGPRCLDLPGPPPPAGECGCAGIPLQPRYSSSTRSSASSKKLIYPLIKNASRLEVSLPTNTSGSPALRFVSDCSSSPIVRTTDFLSTQAIALNRS